MTKIKYRHCSARNSWLSRTRKKSLLEKKYAVLEEDVINLAVPLSIVTVKP